MNLLANTVLKTVSLNKLNRFEYFILKITLQGLFVILYLRPLLYFNMFLHHQTPLNEIITIQNSRS